MLKINLSLQIKYSRQLPHQALKLDLALAPVGQTAPENVIFTVPKDKLDESIDIIEK